MIFYKEGKSEKHLRDIQRILDIQPLLVHQEFLDENIKTYSLEATWLLFQKPSAWPHFPIFALLTFNL